MKRIVNVKRTPIIIDTDTLDAVSLKPQARGIDDVFIVPEDAHMKWNNKLSGNIDEVDVNKGDIIVTFYDTALGTDYIVVKSDEWLSSLENYDKRVQAQKEEWACKVSDKCINK